MTHVVGFKSNSGRDEGAVSPTNPLPVAPGSLDYETVAASQTDQILGATGAVGDILVRLVISVATSATGTVSIKDANGSAIVITAANTPLGVYTVELGLRCTGTTTPGWKVTTGAGATVIGIGRFT